MKIDVEGTEYNVLKGMQKTIGEFRPVIFCEIYRGEASNFAPDETAEFLVNRNYKAYVMCNGELREYARHDDNLYNYLFVPAER